MKDCNKPPKTGIKQLKKVLSLCPYQKDYTILSDSQLIKLLNDSDEKAFSEIFSRYKKILLLYSYHRVGIIEQCKDTIYEMFVEIWENRESIIIPRGLRTFLIDIVKNKILELYRLKKVSPEKWDNLIARLKGSESL